MSKFSNDTVSKEMLTTLLEGATFTIPDVSFNGADYTIPEGLLNSLNASPDVATLDKLVTSNIKGDDTFNRMMAALKLHLQTELDKGRITGSEYSQAYVQLTSAALQSAVQFELGRYQNHWNSILGQIQAITANVQLAITKADAELKIALSKGQVAISQAQYAQTVSQLGLADAQYGLTQQQIASFKLKDGRDAAKMWSDTYVAIKGIDEGTTVPSALNQDSINTVMNNIKQTHGLT